MSSITNRIDAITHIPEAARSVTPPAPRSVKIELTARCNYRCKFCALALRPPSQQSGDMAWPLFARVTREMREAGVEEFGLFYIGESFLVPDLLARAVRFLKQELEAPYVFLTSNASAATDVAVEAVMAAGLDSLKWSINAGSAEQFGDVTGVSRRLFDRALVHVAGAKTIRDRGGYHCRLSASSIRYDGEQGAAMEQLLAERVRPYVDEHYWLPLYSMAAKAEPGEAAIGYTPTQGNRGRADNLVESLPCWALFSEGHVLSDGRLSACCFDASGDWVMADLRTTPFLEAWHSAPFQALRAAHLARDVRGTVCEQCQACGV